MNLDELIALIKRSTQHRHIYHFTDEANFPSIATHGLLSKQRMQDAGFWPGAPGGNPLSWDLDRRKGIFGDVSLCFTQNHPMRYVAQRDGRLPNPRYLGVSPEVLRTEGVRIAFGIANGEQTEILGLVDALQRLDIEVIYRRTNWADPEIQNRLRAAERFEILVPDAIPTKLIMAKY